LTDILIDFEWWKDPAGYRLIGKQQPANLVGELTSDELRSSFLARDWGSPARIVPKSGKRKSFRPLKKPKDLFNAFKGITTDQDVLQFIQRFGPLTKDGLETDRGELVKTVKLHLRAFWDWIKHDRSSDRKNVAPLREQVEKFSRLKTTLTVDELGGLHLRIVPSDLLSALWLHLAKMLSGDKKLVACQHCGTFFHAGVGTGRRLDAKFCSKEHQIQYNSLQRSRQKQSKLG
jgi:hypothetical protein